MCVCCFLLLRFRVVILFIMLFFAIFIILLHMVVGKKGFAAGFDVWNFHHTMVSFGFLLALTWMHHTGLKTKQKLIETKVFYFFFCFFFSFPSLVLSILLHHSFQWIWVCLLRLHTVAFFRTFFVHTTRVRAREQKKNAQRQINIENDNVVKCLKITCKMCCSIQPLDQHLFIFVGINSRCKIPSFQWNNCWLSFRFECYSTMSYLESHAFSSLNQYFPIDLTK